MISIHPLLDTGKADIRCERDWLGHANIQNTVIFASLVSTTLESDQTAFGFRTRPPDTEKNALRPHLKKMWCIGQITGEYLARMEDVLHLYSLSYNEKRPVICYDEMPVQLLGEVVAPLPLDPGKPLRFDYEYRRCGTANILLAIEPLTGKRVVEVSRQRTKADYCRFKQTTARRFHANVKIVHRRYNSDQLSSIVK